MRAQLALSESSTSGSDIFRSKWALTDPATRIAAARTKYDQAGYSVGTQSITQATSAPSLSRQQFMTPSCGPARAGGCGRCRWPP